jgi:hypothetical protein
MGKASMADKMIGKTEKVPITNIVRSFLDHSYLSNRSWAKWQRIQRCTRKESFGKQAERPQSLDKLGHLTIEF